MNKKLVVFLAFVSIISWPAVGFGTAATAVTPLSVEQTQLVNRLSAEIAVLQAKLDELRAQATGLTMSPRLTKPLKKGESDEEVKLLQGVLMTDPELYPEGHQTGYFGRLTEKALRKFQRKAGLPETGEVDNKTIWKINELLTFGAGHSGKIPPGLLRAPGILKKLGLASTTPPGRDTTAPIITGLGATSTTASTTVIIWQTNELTTGVIHYATSTPVDSASSSLMSSDPVWQTNHQLTLANLSTSTTYYFYLVATDYAGNHATSTTGSFFTLSQ